MIEEQLATVHEMAHKSDHIKCQVLTFASGKGGVGKTNMALNAAIALERLEKNVLLIDADSHLANVDLLLGITPTYTLQNVIFGEKSIDEVIFKHASGISVLPNSSDVNDMVLKGSQLAHLLVRHLWTLRKEYDFILIDTAASLSEEIIDFMACADSVLVFTTPEPTAIADAYALIKVLHQKKPTAHIQIVMNIVESEKEAHDVVERFTLVVDYFLNRSVQYAGHVVADWSVVKAVKNQCPFVTEFPESEASKCVMNIARKIVSANGNSDNGDSGNGEKS